MCSTGPPYLASLLSPQREILIAVNVVVRRAVGKQPELASPSQ